MSNTLRIVVFNVLAAPWADPSYYPTSSLPYLSREFRRQKNIDVLKSQAPTTDIFCLQETTEPEFAAFSAALSGFVGFQANHDPSYWSRSITVNPPWELNGTALFVKKSTFSKIKFINRANSDNGNHAAYAEVTYKGKQIGIFSLHLDSDTGGNRNKEMNAILDFLHTRNNDVEILGGDFNFTTQNGNFSRDLQENGFIDVLYTIGNREQTFPESVGYVHSPNFSVIDHIVVRNAVPLEGDVLDYNLWKLYPGTNASAARLTAALQITGSDHFPLWGKVQV